MTQEQYEQVVDSIEKLHDLKKIDDVELQDRLDQINKRYVEELHKANVKREKRESAELRNARLRGDYAI